VPEERPPGNVGIHTLAERVDEALFMSRLFDHVSEDLDESNFVVLPNSFDDREV
jgi:hypothetical protein